MRKQFFLTVCLLLNLATSYGQNLTLKIERIETYYLPWSLTAPMRLTEEDLLNSRNKNIQKKSILDSTAIRDFSLISFHDSQRVKDVKDIDVRMLLKVYFSDLNFLIILVDSFKGYKFFNTYYYFNEDLIFWINTYITKCELGNK